MSVQPVVMVADQRAGWTGTDRQRVRYESAGRANAFLVMEDNTTRTLDRATCGSTGRAGATATRIYAGG